MIMNVTNIMQESTMNFDEFCGIMELDIQSAIHEIEMNDLMERYQYLKENGEEANNNEDDPKLGKLTSLWEKVKQTVIRLFDKARDLIYRISSSVKNEITQFYGASVSKIVNKKKIDKETLRQIVIKHGTNIDIYYTRDYQFLVDSDLFTKVYNVNEILNSLTTYKMIRHADDYIVSRIVDSLIGSGFFKVLTNSPSSPLLKTMLKNKKDLLSEIDKKNSGTKKSWEESKIASSNIINYTRAKCKAYLANAKAYQNLYKSIIEDLKLLNKTEKNTLNKLSSREDEDKDEDIGVESEKDYQEEEAKNK